MATYQSNVVAANVTNLGAYVKFFGGNPRRIAILYSSAAVSSIFLSDIQRAAGAVGPMQLNLAFDPYLHIRDIGPLMVGEFWVVGIGVAGSVTLTEIFRTGN